MAQQSRYIDARTSKPRLWLAARDGKRLPPPEGAIAAISIPESPLEIEFEGLTLEEQRAAIAAFPGGRRFVLVADNTRD